MSMPHGETTGRTHPCTQCGAGAHLACQDSVPRLAHQLVAVQGDPTVNVHTEPGVYEAVGKHLVIGYPLLKRGDQVLMWVRSFAFPMTKTRSDGLAWERRAEMQEALLQAKVDGFENIDVCWVSASELELNAVQSPAGGYYLPDAMMVAGVWYYSYALCLDRPHISAPHVAALDFDNVRKQLKDHAHIHGVLPDAVTKWLKGWRAVPVPPPAPVLQPLSAEGVGVMAGLAADIKLLDDLGIRGTIMPKIPNGVLRQKKLIPIDWQKLDQAQLHMLPSVRGMMAGIAPAPNNLPKFKPGDAVVWDVAGCGYHFCATVAQVRGNEVRIKLRDGHVGWTDFKRMNLCPAWMQGWSTLDGHLWVGPNDGVLRVDPFINAVMPSVVSPVKGVIFESDPPEAPDRVVVSIPSFNTEVPPPTVEVELDAEEESEVWRAFARYCATLNLDTQTSQAEAERALDFFVKMRRKLCNMLE